MKSKETSFRLSMVETSMVLAVWTSCLWLLSWFRFAISLAAKPISRRRLYLFGICTACFYELLAASLMTMLLVVVLDAITHRNATRKSPSVL